MAATCGYSARELRVISKNLTKQPLVLVSARKFRIISPKKPLAIGKPTARDPKPLLIPGGKPAHFVLRLLQFIQQCHCERAAV